MSKSVFLTNEELDFIKNGTAEFNKIKIGIADAELSKQSFLDRAAKVIDAFNNNEKFLIDKYGADSVINMQTGEVTQKEK
jgi:peptidyl-tRNA hydrolase